MGKIKHSKENSKTIYKKGGQKRGNFPRNFAKLRTRSAIWGMALVSGKGKREPEREVVGESKSGGFVYKEAINYLAEGIAYPLSRGGYCEGGWGSSKGAKKGCKSEGQAERSFFRKWSGGAKEQLGSTKSSNSREDKEG